MRVPAELARYRCPRPFLMGDSDEIIPEQADECGSGFC
jgi:hypothetical protein